MRRVVSVFVASFLWSAAPHFKDGYSRSVVAAFVKRCSSVGHLYYVIQTTRFLVNFETEMLMKEGISVKAFEARGSHIKKIDDRVRIHTLDVSPDKGLSEGHSAERSDS